MTEVERKMQLTRFIRQENAMNRMKIKNRESILYGTGNPQFSKEELPLVHDGYLSEDEYGAMRTERNTSQSTFGLRVILAILLFAAVVYLDKNGIIFNGELAAQVIARQVAVSDEEKLIDFVSNFSSSLSDEEKER